MSRVRNESKNSQCHFFNHPMYDIYWNHLNALQKPFQTLLQPFGKQKSQCCDRMRKQPKLPKARNTKKEKWREETKKLNSQKQSENEENSRELWGTLKDDNDNVQIEFGMDSEGEKELEEYIQFVKEKPPKKKVEEEIYHDLTYHLLSDYCNLTSEEDYIKEKCMQELYGKAAENIKLSELPLISLFHSYTVEKNLPLWPAIPIKI